MHLCTWTVHYKDMVSVRICVTIFFLILLMMCVWWGGDLLDENSCITTVHEWREGGHVLGGGLSPCSLVVSAGWERSREEDMCGRTFEGQECMGQQCFTWLTTAASKVVWNLIRMKWRNRWTWPDEDTIWSCTKREREEWGGREGGDKDNFCSYMYTCSVTANSLAKVSKVVWNLW